MSRFEYRRVRALAALLGVLLLAACGGNAPATAQPESGPAAVPATSLAAVDRASGQPLRVVATTTLVGDAVRRIADGLVDLTVLLPAGADPHNYVATPRDMVALGDADIIFANGLGLEDSLFPAVSTQFEAPIVAVNEAVTPLAVQPSAGSKTHAADDPHTWQDPRNVALWATTIAKALARLDPENATSYRRAGEAYAAELRALYEETATTLAAIPQGGRRIVTDHDTFAYFAHAFDFDIVGAVVPAFSTMASVSARDRAALEDQIAAEGVRAIFVGTTVSPRLAEQMARDVGVQLVPLYTDSLSAADGPAATYPELMRYNARMIVDALK